MCDFNYFWSLLGENSGQLQTSISFIAIFLASIAAAYAGKQITIAQNQRLAELRFTILSSTYECKDSINSYKNKVENLKKQLSSQSIVVKNNETLLDLDSYYNDLLDLINNPIKATDLILEDLSKPNFKINLQDLEYYLDALIRIKNSIRNANNQFERELEKNKSH